MDPTTWTIIGTVATMLSIIVSIAPLILHQTQQSSMQQIQYSADSEISFSEVIKRLSIAIGIGGIVFILLVLTTLSRTYIIPRLIDYLSFLRNAPNDVGGFISVLVFTIAMVAILIASIIGGIAIYILWVRPLLGINDEEQ